MVTRYSALFLTRAFRIRFPAGSFFFFFFFSFAPAIFGAQPLNPQGGRNTGMFPVGCFGYGERRKIITDFSVVSYGDTGRFKVLFSKIPAPVPDL